MKQDYEWHVRNLRALSEQEGAPVGYVSVEYAANSIAIRDELIHDLKCIIEDDARDRLRTRRRVAESLSRGAPG